jgi:hypothetical protein
MSIKMIFASAAALAMAAGTPAFAAKSQGERQHAVASDAGGGEKAKKICRTFRNTISRMKAEKVCLTRAEWKKVEAEQ